MAFLSSFAQLLPELWAHLDLYIVNINNDFVGLCSKLLFYFDLEDDFEYDLEDDVDLEDNDAGRPFAIV